MEDYELTRSQLESIDTNKDFNKYNTFIVLFEPKSNMYSIKLGYGMKNDGKNADWGKKTYIKLEDIAATLSKLEEFTIAFHEDKMQKKAGNMFDININQEDTTTKLGDIL